jgi:hypothetical protein
VSAITIFAMSGMLTAGVICVQHPAARPEAVLRGVVVDAGTAQPLARVLVRVEDRLETLTTDAGVFEFG